ncbi:MAG: hypothetical protein IPL53_03960 [Ignavibacteria bacterium]|nr:hypothetical protein [Ignavibacteria bacterium]
MGIQKILGKSDFETAKDILNSFSGKLIYNRSSGKDFEMDFLLSDEGLKLNIFDIDELELHWDGPNSVFSGEFKITIPGSLGRKF